MMSGDPEMVDSESNVPSMVEPSPKLQSKGTDRQSVLKRLQSIRTDATSSDGGLNTGATDPTDPTGNLDVYETVADVNEDGSADVSWGGCADLMLVTVLQMDNSAGVNEGTSDGVRLSMNRHWSDLPKDILNVISDNLIEISDFISMNAVSKNWHLGTSLSKHPPQFPWLLLHRGPYAYGNEEPVNLIKCYSIMSKKGYKFSLDPVASKSVVGSCGGYVIANRMGMNDNSITIVNPVDKESIKVPDLDFIDPILMWSDAVDIGNFLVVGGNVKSPGQHTVGFCRPDGNAWEYVDRPYQMVPHAVQNESYSFLQVDTGETVTIDIISKHVMSVLPPLEPPVEYEWEDCFVKSAEGLVRVIRYYDGQTASRSFKIYKMDFNTVSWIEIFDIGDKMMFLNFCDGFSLDSSCFSGIKGNVIYYYEVIDGYSHIYRFNIINKITEEICEPIDHIISWYIPRMQKIVPKIRVEGDGGAEEDGGAVVQGL